MKSVKAELYNDNFQNFSEQFQSELTELCNRYGIEANYTQVKKIFYEEGGNICG